MGSSGGSRPRTLRRAVAVLVAAAAVVLPAATASAADQTVFAYGDAKFFGSTGEVFLEHPVIGAARTPGGDGYWLVGPDGRVHTFGAAEWYGSVTRNLASPVVGIAAKPQGGGYWLAARDGGVFTFGDVLFHGSAGRVRLAQPIVGIAPTPSGKGYWLVASDGGIFTFGDARFFGSTGAMRLNRPIVGMAPTPTGNGYWLVASDGGIFTFGDARFFGSTGAIRLNQPIVAMAPTGPNGYWLLARDGGIFTFGNAGFHGTMVGRTRDAAVALVATPSGNGYTIVTTGSVLGPGALDDEIRIVEGSHRVGRSAELVRPGRYRTRIGSPDCHWERWGDFAGTSASVLGQNTSSPLRQVVDILETDAGFFTTKCAEWTSDLFPITTNRLAPFADGLYIVGLDIAPGTWRAPGGPACTWRRLSGFTGVGGEVLSTGSGDSAAVVVVDSRTDGFETQGCGTWRKD